MSSEQPKLNNSEANNSTSGESQTAPQNTVMASQPAPVTHTTDIDDADESRAPGDVASDNCSISLSRNKRPLKKAKSFAAPSLV